MHFARNEKELPCEYFTEKQTIFFFLSYILSLKVIKMTPYFI